jgi:hypothetical protein
VQVVVTVPVGIEGRQRRTQVATDRAEADVDAFATVNHGIRAHARPDAGRSPAPGAQDVFGRVAPLWLLATGPGSRGD